MKLLRFGAAGQERPGVLAADGGLRDLSGMLFELGPRQIGPEGLELLRGLDVAALPLVAEPVRLGPPLSGVGKIIAIGLNYRDHAIESGLPLPAEPVIFMKPASCIAGPGDDLAYPPGAGKLDHEVELAVVIGSVARRVSRSEALSAVAGYAVMNDVSERAWQLERNGTWDKGKGADGFAPFGPWLVTADEVPDPQALRLWCKVNGEVRQDGTTAEMIFPVAELVSYVSQFMTLYPGDIITTGTPAGVGMGHKPEPRWLRPGDVVEMGIDGLGIQRTRVIAAS
jgi:2-keto-4-pentenoate hydratase/2-oxohepta-3-ene-1,7-dioic acid hydratase in catechol pathway